MSDKSKVTPRKLSGFMELPPEKQIIFDRMLAQIRQAFDQNCFMPLDTPILELSEVLLAKSGGEIDKEVYHFTKGDTDVCMRYDLTVPLARYVAMNSETISFPFKRYQIGKVFRGERAQKGRFREFYQCDADIIGHDMLSVAADAECIFLAQQIFQKLNLDILIQVSNRNILFGYIEDLGYTHETAAILTVLDKINKIGIDHAKQSLLELQVSAQATEKLINMVLLNGRFADILPQLSQLSQNETYIKGLADLKELNSYFIAMGMPEERYVLNVGIIRGQNYYTGTIFETIVPAHPEFGTVCAGGRYDNLATYFTDKKLPGVGMSIGFTRLFDLLDSQNMLGNYPLSQTELVIIPLGETVAHSFELASFFKKNQIKCEVNYDARSFKAKMRDANKKQIPFVMIVGEDEMRSQKYSLKNMRTSDQISESIDTCLQYIQQSSINN